MDLILIFTNKLMRTPAQTNPMFWFFLITLLKIRADKSQAPFLTSLFALSNSISLKLNTNATLLCLVREAQFRGIIYSTPL